MAVIKRYFVPRKGVLWSKKIMVIFFGNPRWRIEHGESKIFAADNYYFN